MRVLISVSALSLLVSTSLTMAASGRAEARGQDNAKPTSRLQTPWTASKELQGRSSIKLAETACGSSGFMCPDGYFCCVNSIGEYYCAPDGGSC